MFATASTGSTELRDTTRERELLQVLPADLAAGAAAGLAELAVHQPAAQKPVQPAVAQPSVQRDVATREPAERGLRVGVIAHGPVVPEVGDVALVGARVAHDVVDAELWRDQARAAAAPHVLEDERQPQHRHVGHVQHRGSRHHEPLGDVLHLSRGEVVVRFDEVARGDGGVRRVGAVQQVVHREVAAQMPHRGAFLEIGGRVLDDPRPVARVVAHSLADHDAGGVEQPRPAHREQVAGVLDVAHAVGLERGALALDQGPAGEADLLLFGEQGDGIGGVARDAEAAPVQQRLDYRIRSLEAARRPAGQDAAAAAGILRSAVAERAVRTDGPAQRIQPHHALASRRRRRLLRLDQARHAPQQRGCGEGDRTPHARPACGSAASSPSESARARRRSMASATTIDSS
jgi:hypothetical protein